MQIRFDHNLHKLRADISAYGKQVAFGHVLGLTQTAQDVKAAEIAEMGRVFDRPTRWTLNSVFVRRATVAKPEATTWLKDDGQGGIAPSNYLTAQIEGGTRKQKRFEKALQYAQVLPQGWYAIPGPGARLDRHGNLSGAQIVQILSAFGAFRMSGYSMNRTERSKKTNRRLRNFFASTPLATMRTINKGRLPWGIYERMANGEIRTILRFRPRVQYKRRLDWYRVADEVVAKKLRANIAAGIGRAMQTAR